MLARILTENKNFGDVKTLVREKFHGCTFIKAEGMWHGDMEHNLIIEISYSDDIAIVMFYERIEKLAYSIKKLNKQQAVLVQYIDCREKII